MAQKYYKPSWQDIEKACQALAKKIKPIPDLMVAITKGGLPVAVILANKYFDHPPVITLQLKEVQTEGQADYQVKKVKLISPLNAYPIKGKTVLIIDDVADSGATLKEAVDIVKTHQPKSLTVATLHYKPRTIIKPDIWVKKINDNVWINYPWEKKIRP